MVFNMNGWGDDFTNNSVLETGNFDHLIKNNDRKVRMVLKNLGLRWYSANLVELYRNAFKDLLDISLDVPCLENMASLKDFCSENDFNITFDEREKDIKRMEKIVWYHTVKNRKKDCTIAHTLDRQDRIIIIQSNTLTSIWMLLKDIGRGFVDRVAEVWRWSPIPVFLDDRNKEAGLTL